MDKEYRINGFEQIKSFYSWVFAHADKRVSPQHISLYLFLINQNNRNNWIEWFKCPYDLAMAGACIGNKKTYYTCLADLERWGFIKYEKGMNEWKAPLIKIEVLKSTSTDTATVPQSEPLPTTLPTTLLLPLPTTLPTHIYKLITDNLQLITDNIEAIVKMFGEENKRRKKKTIFIPPTLEEVKQFFSENGYTEESAIKAFNHYSFGDWIDSKGTAVKDWKRKMNNVWFKPENKTKSFMMP